MGFIRERLEPRSYYSRTSLHIGEAPSHFKLAQLGCGLWDESFLEKIKEGWRPFDPSFPESPPIQFHQNLKRAKQFAITWSKEKRKKYGKNLEEIEAKLEICYQGEGHGFLTEDQKNEIMNLEENWRKLILESY
jgi:hypothetical protein